ncbi:MAG: sulfatase activating formylglycine-generating enzyme [Arenicella sp.]|jgi:formylglycine-generating enzyme required for sulfatase activity
MHGNVWEWVQDCYHSSYIGGPNDGKARTDCDTEYRVLRGGSWFHTANSLRAAYRFSTFGFRLAVDN